jgi:hypothetical protein
MIYKKQINIIFYVTDAAVAKIICFTSLVIMLTLQKNTTKLNWLSVVMATAKRYRNL